VISHALAVDLRLDVEATQRRGHAISLSARAARAGYEVVVVLGGDGTVNEALQGIAGSGVRLAIIPGGAANVWARTLGLPNDAVEATSVVLRKLRERDCRSVSLGVANGRYFGFCAGLGFDGAVVRMVEERLLLKRAVRQATFLWCGVLAYLATLRTDVRMSLSVDSIPTDDRLRTVVACNSDPYTFLGRLPARMCPRADLDAGLDLTGLTDTRVTTLARVAYRALTGDRVSRLGRVRGWHDHRSYELRCTAPAALHVDGEYLGETDHLMLASAPDACSVIA